MMRSIRWLLPILAAAFFAFAGCEGPAGPAGSVGPEGPPGPAGSVSSTTQDALTITITSVTVPASGGPVVSFSVVDQDGLPLTNLVSLWQSSSSTVRVSLAKLIAGPTSGDSSRWQSYKNSASGPTGLKMLQATYDSAGTLADVGGNGSYTYTLSYDPHTVTYPTGLHATDPNVSLAGQTVGFVESAIHRVAIQISGSGLPAGNGVLDFIPNGAAVNNANNRIMVQTASCNECHNKLVLHGSRYETKYCMVCHNPGSTDPDTGNTVDMRVMAHKIHRGKDLGVLPYQIIGYQNSVHDYSLIGFPQDIRNCSKCHDASDTATPQAANWYNLPSKQACTSCHDQITFDGTTPGTKIDGTAGYIHQAQADNSGCAGCHAGSGSSIRVQTAHLIPANEEGKKFAYAFVGTPSYSAGTVTVSYRAYNPLTSTNYNLVSDTEALTTASPEFNKAAFTSPTVSGAGSAARLALIVSWDTSDYSGIGSGNPPGQPMSIDVLDDATYNGTTNVDNGDCTYTLQIVLPAGATGTAIVALEGHPAGWNGTSYISTTPNPPASQNDILRVPVQSVWANVGITETAVARRGVVSITQKCNNCHGNLSMHGNNRTNEGQVCVICHNPFATDINRRPKTTATLASDGKFEEPIDFKRMIHALHSQGSTKRQHALQVYGFSGPNSFSTTTVHFPGRVSDCTTCHVASTFELPLSQDVFGSTVATAPDAANPWEATPHTFGTAAVAATPTNTITLTGNEYVNSTSTPTGIPVRVKSASTGTLPGGLTASTDYYIVGVSGNAFQLSLTPGGSAVTLADVGTGTGSVFTIYPAALDTQAEDLKISRTASVCSACHDSYAATSHMAQNGGSVEIRYDTASAPTPGQVGDLAIDLTKTSAQQASGPGEACPLCHGPGRFADIAVWHVVTPNP